MITYLVSFFIDSISIFFSSFCVIIQVIIITINYINHNMSQSSPQSKALDLQMENIEISQSKGRVDSKSLLEENKAIKKQNLLLKKQLQVLSNRLDVEIIKRITSQKKKQHSEVAHMQLQNAYKKYQIYKKQASIYRRKLQSLNEDSKVQDFQRKISIYQKDNYQLKQELKQLKKVLKQQQKGLAELGLEGYPSIVSQNQKLKEQVRILKKEIDSYRRALQLSKKAKAYFDDKITESISEQRMVSLPLKMKGKAHEIINNKQKIQKDLNQDSIDVFREKTQKDHHRIKSLAGQKKRLRDLVQNLKLQLLQKEKENVYLKDKINQLRRNNQLLQSQAIIKRPAQISTNSKPKRDRTKQKRVNSQLSEISNMKVKSSKASEMPKLRVWNKNKKSEAEVTDNSRNTNRPQNTQNKLQPNKVMKWSHQHLSSKIKQMQILEHQMGHIRDLHVRYQKGQPKKYQQTGLNSNYKVFACSKEEFIKNVEGAFAHGYLQYLTVTSNLNRIEKYGNFLEYEQPSQGDHFQFQVRQGQFPGALFGENDENGVKRLGCFIHKQN